MHLALIIKPTRFGTHCLFHLHRRISAYEDGTDSVFRKVGIQNSDVGELPKRIHTTIRTRRKFEINKFIFILNFDGVDKFILKNSTGTTWIGLIWLRIGTNGGAYVKTVMNIRVP